MNLPRLVRPFVYSALFAASCCAPLSGAGSEAPLLRALVLTGDNNHKWKETTPVIVDALKSTGRFSVDVVEDVPGMKPGIFAPYDVIVSNYNTYGSKRAEPVWDEATKTAFLDHIRAGRGLVIVHAGSSFFYDWPEFQALACGTWKDGTNHGKIHDNRVTFTAEKSPVTDGLEPFWIRDEFWQKIKVAPGAKALAEVTPLAEFKGSGQPEQIMFSTEVGGGRGFALFLGHDVAAMSNPAFQSLLQRGTEWAATGKVTIPPASNWPSGQPGAGEVTGATAAPATLEQLIVFIRNYKYAGDRSGLIEGEKLLAHTAGTPEGAKAAAALAALLGDPAVSDDAKEFVCTQLRLIGGEAEVRPLAALLKDPKLAASAVEALEAIPGPAAARALRVASAGSESGLKAQIAQALKRRENPLGLVKPNLSAAFGESPDAGLLLAALRSSDPDKWNAALLAFGSRYSSKTAARLASSLKGLSPETKEAVLRIIADRRETKALPAILSAAAAEGDPAAAAVFIEVLGGIGDASAVPFLLTQLSTSDPKVRDAAVASLERVRGTEATVKIVDTLDLLPPESQPAVLTVLGLRRDPAALTATLAAAKSRDKEIRGAAIRAVGKIAVVSQVAGILAAIEGAPADDLPLWEKSLASAAGAGDRNAGVPAIASALSTAGPEMVPILLTAAGAAGTGDALVLLREKLQSPDEQVRRVALSAMGRALNPVLLDDLQEAVSGDASPVLRKLALRKLSDTLIADEALDPGRALAVLEPSATAASDSDDRRAILAALGRVKSEKALEVVARIEAADPAVAPEASAATANIYKLLKKIPPPKPASPQPNH